MQHAFAYLAPKLHQCVQMVLVSSPRGWSQHAKKLKNESMGSVHGKLETPSHAFVRCMPLDGTAGPLPLLSVYATLKTASGPQLAPWTHPRAVTKRCDGETCRGNQII